MKAIRLFILLSLVLLITLASTGRALASTLVWIVIGPPLSQPYPGSTFSTDIKISSWNGAAGAIDLMIRYDPGVITPVNFTTPSNAYFSSNCSAYSNLNNPGQTRITCFQVTQQESQESPIILGTITWMVKGQKGSSTDIKIDPATVVASDWSSVEALVYGQKITISTYRLYLPLVRDQ
jgi:hypothetical protein